MSPLETTRNCGAWWDPDRPQLSELTNSATSASIMYRRWLPFPSTPYGSGVVWW